MKMQSKKMKYYSHIAKVQNLFIQHPSAVRCLKKLREGYDYRNCTGNPKNFVLTGSTGVGKTTVRRQLEAELLPKHKEDRIEHPSISITIPSKPTIKNMAEEILLAMGDENFAKGGSVDKTNRIFHAVEALDIKMFIFDEMQHFVDGGNKNAPRDVADWLKVLIDTSKVSTVLMGTKPVLEIIQSNDQIRRRFSTVLEIKPFSIDDLASAQEFAAIVKQIDQSLGLPNAIDYQDIQLIESMHFATNGIMDYIVKLMVQAYELAREAGKTQITRALLEEAFTESIWVEGVGKMNPFHKQFIRRKLSYKRNMPFAA